ncbi:MAG: hypothetical protein ABGY41_04710 [Candidatus Poribacteria bacterium]
MDNRTQRMQELLLGEAEEWCSQRAKPSRFLSPEAGKLIDDLEHHPHAFLVGCLATRMTESEDAWPVPYRLGERLGYFDIGRLAESSRSEIVRAVREPTPLHRYKATACHIYLAIQRVAGEYAGDASRLWSGSIPGAQLVRRMQQFEGVGQKISTMAVVILHRGYGVEFTDLHEVDIPVDRAVQRVFTRLGLSPEGAKTRDIQAAARRLYPEFPGMLDNAVWKLGKELCTAEVPNCGECYLRGVCPSSGRSRAATPSIPTPTTGDITTRPSNASRRVDSGRVYDVDDYIRRFLRADILDVARQAHRQGIGDSDGYKTRCVQVDHTRVGAKWLVRQVLDHARAQGTHLPFDPQTAPINTGVAVKYLENCDVTVLHLGKPVGRSV